MWKKTVEILALLDKGSGKYTTHTSQGLNMF